MQSTTIFLEWTISDDSKDDELYDEYSNNYLQECTETPPTIFFYYSSCLLFVIQQNIIKQWWNITTYSSIDGCTSTSWTEFMESDSNIFWLVWRSIDWSWNWTGERCRSFNERERSGFWFHLFLRIEASIRECWSCYGHFRRRDNLDWNYEDLEVEWTTVRLRLSSIFITIYCCD